MRATAAACALLLGATPAAALSSYAVEAEDEPGSSTGAAAVALGVPDYGCVGDAGLGFGGTNSDVFAPGESTVLRFPAPLRNVPGQADLLVSAFVGGAGASDAALVGVEVSSDGVAFTSAGSFDTATGRDPAAFPPQETDFASVKHFAIEFGAADLVTHVRLTNLAGTAEGLRLDAVEGLHPATGASHAFELRVDRYRLDSTGRFRVRVKNLANPGGAGIRELRIEPGPDPSRLEDTYVPLPALHGSGGALICVEHCIMDTTQTNPQPVIPFGRHVWSLDGVVEAPAGAGLAPGRQAANVRTGSPSFDTDDTASFLAGFTFHVVFTDDSEQSLSFEDDVVAGGVPGALHQKYQYFSAAPQISGPQRTDTYEFSLALPACSNGLDDDGDGRIDFDGGASWNGGVPVAEPDPPCTDKPNRNRETPNASCGLGAELAIALGVAFAWRRRSGSARRT